MPDDDISFPSEWDEFLALVREIIARKDQQPARNYIRALYDYQQDVLSALQERDFNTAFREGWLEFASQEENTQTAQLLKTELRAVTAMLREGVGEFSAREWSRVRLRDLLNAARVVVDSLIDLLGDGLGMVIKGPLTVFSELLEIYEAA